MPKAPSTTAKPKQQPLYDSIRQDTTVVAKVKKTKFAREQDESVEPAIPSDISKKILKLAKMQAAEDSESMSESESGEGVSEDVDDEGYVRVDQQLAEDEELSGWNPSVKVNRKEEKQVETELPNELVELYTRMGKWMSTYRSGKVLKGLKMIPGLANWEEVIYLMDPLSWTPAAHFEAIKIFVSNLKPASAQRYLNLVLLPAIRDDIITHKKLNFHYYEALKKALYKAPAFFKGVYLPLVLDPSTSVREAVIVGSVVTKMSTPVLHAAAALYRIALIPASDWTPVVSILGSALISKKYALPAKVVEELVNHFCAFSNYNEPLPVVWHVGLLSFVQIYKGALGNSQKGRIHEFLRVKGHRDISVEIRRELEGGELAAITPMQF